MPEETLYSQCHLQLQEITVLFKTVPGSLLHTLLFKMTSLNVANVINMLANTFQIASITQTPVTPFKIEMHNEIQNILQNVQNVTLYCNIEIFKKFSKTIEDIKKCFIQKFYGKNTSIYQG